MPWIHPTSHSLYYITDVAAEGIVLVMIFDALNEVVHLMHWMRLWLVNLHVIRRQTWLPCAQEKLRKIKYLVPGLYIKRPYVKEIALGTRLGTWYLEVRVILMITKQGWVFEVKMFLNGWVWASKMFLKVCVLKKRMLLKGSDKPRTFL